MRYLPRFHPVRLAYESPPPRGALVIVAFALVVVVVALLLAACGGPCEPPPCENPGRAEWCVLHEADGGVRVVGTP